MGAQPAALPCSYPRRPGGLGAGPLPGAGLRLPALLLGSHTGRGGGGRLPDGLGAGKKQIALTPCSLIVAPPPPQAHYLPPLLNEAGSILRVTAATAGWEDSPLPLLWSAHPAVVAFLQVGGGGGADRGQG